MKICCSIILLPLFFTSCFEEVADPAPEADRFELSLPADMEQFIYTSRDSAYAVGSPGLYLFFNDQPLVVSELRVRGKSALNFRRKSFAVFLDEPILVEDPNSSESRSLSRFKLLALAQDQSYIENRIAFGILKEAGLMPLFYKFVELRINGKTQGVYMLMEDPEQFYRENGSEFILRRGFNHSVDDYDYFPSVYFRSADEYLDRFREIYSLLPQLRGEELYTELAERLNIEMYFRKMGIDYLLMNGDYTDELYLFGTVENNLIRYQLIPWDYDDIFKDYPHEIGVAWGMGNIYGKRYYATMEDVINEIGEKLIFSIEDDLDYTIASDSVLYNYYLDAIAGFFDILDQELIDRVFRETKEELTTFYNSPSVVEQSRYDLSPTSPGIWNDHMDEKKVFLEERLKSVSIQLEKKK